MKIIITGAAGYIGSVLCPMLLDSGYHVVALDNLMYGQTSLLACVRNPLFTFHRVNVVDIKHKDLYDGADFIIPLAGTVGINPSEEQKEYSEEINIAYFNIYFDILNKSKVVFPGSYNGYGVGSLYCDEESTRSPKSLYGYQKIKAEGIVSKLENHVIYRFASLFGVSSRMRFDLLLNDFVYRAVFNHYIDIFDTNHLKNLIHVCDAARAFLFAINAWKSVANHVFNVGSPVCVLTKMELAKRVQAIIGNVTIKETNSDHNPDSHSCFVNTQRIHRLGWFSQFDIEDGISEVAAACSMIPRCQFSNDSFN